MAPRQQRPRRRVRGSRRRPRRILLRGPIPAPCSRSRTAPAPPSTARLPEGPRARTVVGHRDLRALVGASTGAPRDGSPTRCPEGRGPRWDRAGRPRDRDSAHADRGPGTHVLGRFVGVTRPEEESQGHWIVEVAEGYVHLMPESAPLGAWRRRERLDAGGGVKLRGVHLASAEGGEPTRVHAIGHGRLEEIEAAPIGVTMLDLEAIRTLREFAAPAGGAHLRGDRALGASEIDRAGLGRRRGRPIAGPSFGTRTTKPAAATPSPTRAHPHGDLDEGPRPRAGRPGARASAHGRGARARSTTRGVAARRRPRPRSRERALSLATRAARRSC